MFFFDKQAWLIEVIRIDVFCIISIKDWTKIFNCLDSSETDTEIVCGDVANLLNVVKVDNAGHSEKKSG